MVAFGCCTCWVGGCFTRTARSALTHAQLRSYEGLTLSAREVYAAKDLLGAPLPEEADFRLLPLIDMPPDLALSEVSFKVLGLKDDSLVSSVGVIGESPPLEDEV